MKRFTPICGLLYLCTLSLLPAQQAPITKAPLPEGPLIQIRAADFAKWVITAKGKKVAKPGDTAAPSASSPPGEDRSMEVLIVTTTTKTGSLKVREMISPNGTTWRTWCISDMQITLGPGPNDASVSRGAPPPDLPPSPFNVDYSRSDFPDMDMVTLKNYVGIQTAFDKKCLVFKTVRSPDGLMAPIECTAYVDVVTRLPVACQTGISLLTYEFLSPPTEPLVVPQQIKKIFANDLLSKQSGARQRTP